MARLRRQCLPLKRVAAIVGQWATGIGGYDAVRTLEEELARVASTMSPVDRANHLTECRKAVDCLSLRTFADKTMIAANLYNILAQGTSVADALAILRHRYIMGQPSPADVREPTAPCIH
jgi:hypothetical protein